MAFRKNGRKAASATRTSQNTWPIAGELLSPLSIRALEELNLFPDILESVWPLTKSQKARLPESIAALSQILTIRRSELRTPYWNMAEYCSAYLYYFLPWNLIRLAALLPNLPIDAPEEKDGLYPLLLDAGSGLLTLPLALWLAKPEWRHKRLKIIAIDSTRRPLQLGKKIMNAWAARHGQTSWEIETVTAPIHHLARFLPGNSQPHYPWLASAVNVLNEIQKLPRGFNRNDETGFLDNLLDAWQAIWSGNTPMLFIEPGTRLGGTAIMHLRESAIQLGLFPHSPCTHYKQCPLLARSNSSLSKSWCHFVFSAQDAPGWIKNLSAQAGLYKTSLTLSPLFLSQIPPSSRLPGNALPCRVISKSFSTPAGESRYGCAKPGLCLLPDSRNARSGALCLAKSLTGNEKKDAKSKAIILAPSYTAS